MSDIWSVYTTDPEFDTECQLAGFTEPRSEVRFHDTARLHEIIGTRAAREMREENAGPLRYWVIAGRGS